MYELLQYISEFGFDEPFENLRTEMFEILEDTATTSTSLSFSHASGQSC